MIKEASKRGDRSALVYLATIIPEERCIFKIFAREGIARAIELRQEKPM
ncbi:MAG: hypothetical protein KF893_10580 [Caldilineaceae bacterium]|nr:hypothetical protein [Caldilineaceae bacterium]